MKIKIKILSITLVVFLFNPQLFADIYEVNIDDHAKTILDK